MGAGRRRPDMTIEALRERRRAVVAMTRQGRSIAEIAVRLGVSRMTVSRNRADARAGREPVGSGRRMRRGEER